MTYLKRTADSTAEPVTLDELKTYARITLAHEDDLLNGFISEARQYCEAYTGMSFVTQTWTKSIDRFPVATRQFPYAELPLDHGPLQSVTSIAYTDSTRLDTTMASTDYLVIANAGTVAPTNRSYWPTSLNVPDGVLVTYQTGFGGTAPATTASIAAVPTMIKQAIKVYASWRYRSRDADEMVPKAVHSLLDMASPGLYMTWTPEQYK